MLFLTKNELRDKNISSGKWVIKNDEKYKARLVIRGFDQKYCIGFREIFSPVVNTCSRFFFYNNSE